MFTFGVRNAKMKHLMALELRL